MQYVDNNKKTCMFCEKILSRREGEKPYLFEKKKYCDQKCYGKWMQKNTRKLTSEDIQKIVSLLETRTLQEVGDIYHLSKERIRQLLKRDRIKQPTRSFKYICTICKREKSFTRVVDTPFVCLICRFYQKHHKEPHLHKRRREHEIGSCIRCGKRRGNRGGYCNSCYVSKYAQEHPEYTNKQKQRQKIYIKQYYKNHKEKYATYSKKWKQKNKFHLQEYFKQYYIKKLLGE